MYSIQQGHKEKMGWFLMEVRFELSLDKGFGKGVEKKGNTREGAVNSEVWGLLPAQQLANVWSWAFTFWASIFSFVERMGTRWEHV